MAREKLSISQKVVSLVLEGGDFTLFTDQFGKPSVIYKDNPLVGYSIRSRQFKHTLSRLTWGVLGATLPSSALDAVLSSLEGVCASSEVRRELYNRVAFHGDAVYYDLGDDRQVVKITSAGWEVMDEAPVAFKRYTHQKAQVAPERGGDLRDLLRFFNLKDEKQKVLLLTYLPVCLMAHVNRPLLLIHGSQGSGKSTALTFIRSLIDPSAIPLLSPSRQTDEFIRQAAHNYCFFLDNVSSISSETSDALCRLVTGMSFAKRELYTDDEDVLFSFKRVTGFNGVAQFANKPDLLDRSLILQLERIEGSVRKKDADIQVEFEEQKPKMMGALFDSVSYLLAHRGALDLEDLPRMADYYEFAANAAVHLGYGVEAYAEAFQENVEDQHLEAINASVVASLILEFMAGHTVWNRSSSELFQKLKEKAVDQGVSSGLPNNPNWLWRKITEVKPELEAVGVRAEKDNTVRPRRIILTRLPSYRMPLDVPPPAVAVNPLTA